MTRIIHSMKTVVVTGGTGLVGNAIRAISASYTDYEFVFLSSKMFDLTSLEDTRKMFRTYQPAIVIHLAACVGGLYKNMNNKVEMLEKNLLINFNVVSCAHEFHVEKLVACLSTCIFPDQVTYPIDESMLHNGPPHVSNDAYAYAKRMLEIHCSAYREQFGDRFICVTPTNIYGPHDNFNLEDAHVLPALIHKCYLAKQEGRDFVIRGSGKPLRQFIYSEDLANMIMRVVEKGEDPNMILSVPDEYSIKQVGHLIAACFDYEDRIVFASSFADGQYKKTVSSDKWDTFSKEDPISYTSIQNGISQTVAWFKEHYAESRV
jgi:GDP-L-fucose synthase